MAKLEFPPVNAPYRGFMGNVRGMFRQIASYLEKSPQATDQLNTQLAVLAEYTGFETTPDPLPSTQAIVSDGQVLNVTGGTVTLSVADNTVTAEYTPE